MPTSTPGSSNPFPSVLLVEGAAPATPASGKQRLFVDIADGLLKLKDDAGTVTPVGGGGGVSDLDALLALSSGQDTADALTGAAAPDAANVFATMADLPTGGGGGLAHSFVGYDTIGGTFTALTASRYYLKKITLAAAAQVVSVDAHLRPNTDAIATSLYAVVLSDISDAPGVLLAGSATGGIYLSNSSSMPGAGRWFCQPIGAYLPAGDYWIGIANAAATALSIANDGSGSDRYFTVSGSMLMTGAYPSAWAITTGSVKYSIRASILS